MAKLVNTRSSGGGNLGRSRPCTTAASVLSAEGEPGRARRWSTRASRVPVTDGLHAAPFSAVAWPDGETVRIAVAGEIDLANSPQLKAAVLAAIERPIPPKEVRIDLSDVTFMDASAVGALVAGREAARRCGVGFAVQNPRDTVLRILDILGLTEALRLAKVDR